MFRPGICAFLGFFLMVETEDSRYSMFHIPICRSSARDPDRVYLYHTLSHVHEPFIVFITSSSDLGVSALLAGKNDLVTARFSTGVHTHLPLLACHLVCRPDTSTTTRNCELHTWHPYLGVYKMRILPRLVGGRNVTDFSPLFSLLRVLGTGYLGMGSRDRARRVLEGRGVLLFLLIVVRTKVLSIGCVSCRVISPCIVTPEYLCALDGMYGELWEALLLILVWWALHCPFLLSSLGRFYGEFDLQFSLFLPYSCFHFSSSFLI